MKRVIGGKTYNTATATELVDVGNDRSSDDFKADYTSLYRTAKGAYFIAGVSGPLGRWAQRLDNGNTGGGRGIEVVSEAEARELVEIHGTTEEYIAAFGEPEEA